MGIELKTRTIGTGYLRLPESKFDLMRRDMDNYNRGATGFRRRQDGSVSRGTGARPSQGWGRPYTSDRRRTDR